MAMVRVRARSARWAISEISPAGDTKETYKQAVAACKWSDENEFYEIDTSTTGGQKLAERASELDGQLKIILVNRPQERRLHGCTLTAEILSDGTALAENPFGIPRIRLRSGEWDLSKYQV